MVTGPRRLEMRRMDLYRQVSTDRVRGQLWPIGPNTELDVCVGRMYATSRDTVAVQYPVLGR